MDDYVSVLRALVTRLMSHADHDRQSCFAGGNYLLGGAYLQKQEYIDLGLAVTDSCHATYNNTKTGLGPLGKFPLFPGGSLWGSP